MGRPGYGERHPGLVELLATHVPAVELGVTWGVTPLRAAAYPEVPAPPVDVVMSVRVIVEVGDDVVVCTNANGLRHPFPGGRREPGETLAETAVREVHEETGWQLDPDTLAPLGFLHFRYVDPVDPAWLHLPHPDLVHLVYSGTAVGRAADDWTDTEGFELSSELLARDAALEATAGEPLAWPFLELLDPRTGRMGPCLPTP
jgi:ADP-ribose pyrophosphatase YjhB (NUDIX family)